MHKAWRENEHGHSRAGRPAAEGALAKGEERRGRGSSGTRRPHRSAKEREVGSATQGFSASMPYELFLKAYYSAVWRTVC